MVPKIDLSRLWDAYRRLTKRERIIFYGTSVVVLIVLLDLAVVSPIYRSIKYLDRRILDTEADIRKSILLLGQKDQVTKESDYYSGYLLPAKTSEERILILMKRVEELANQASINLLFVKPAGAGAGQQEGVDRVNLECEGKIEQVIRFFHAVENSKLLIKIEKYSLQPASRGSSVVRCSATVALSSLS